MKRLCSALLLGIAVSLGLFWLMQFMIMSNQQGFKDTDDVRMVEFVRLKRETKLQAKTRKQPEPPPPPENRPPPPPLMQTTQTHVSHDLPQINMPKLDIPLQTRASGSLLNGVRVGAEVAGTPGIGEISTNLIPLVRIPPRYPMRAASRRIEGWVKVEFTITKNGTVKDADVVDSQPSSIFNRAALQAIAKWKFKPKVVDGKPVEQRAVQILQFKLSR